MIVCSAGCLLVRVLWLLVIGFFRLGWVCGCVWLLWLGWLVLVVFGLWRRFLTLLLACCVVVWLGDVRWLCYWWLLCCGWGLVGLVRLVVCLWRWVVLWLWVLVVRWWLDWVCYWGGLFSGRVRWVSYWVCWRDCWLWLVLVLVLGVCWGLFRLVVVLVWRGLGRVCLGLMLSLRRCGSFDGLIVVLILCLGWV